MTVDNVQWILKFDLQLFADDSKTEKATPKKRQDARKKGQVLQSRELTMALVLIFLFLSLKLFGGMIYSEIAAFTKKFLLEYSQVKDPYTENILTKMFIDIVVLLLRTLAPVFATAVLTGLIASYAQVGFLFTMESMGFKFERINPISGFKRIFALRSLVELVKSLAKITVVGLVAYSYLAGEAENILNMMSMDVLGIAAYIADTSINVAIRICLVMFILGVMDYGYQWWEYEKSLKMSKQEVKEEYKMMEGNPEIKGKIKQKMRQASMRRMLQQVPKADVVITNPTHFAVAIKYDPEKSSAPQVVAKGQDFIAQRIKDVARENKVEIVENKVLARTLYNTVDVGESIPQDLYQAVAEVLAFVYSLQGKTQAAASR